jgi:hypothetical protein
VECKARQCKAKQCNAMQRNAMQRNAMQGKARQGNAMRSGVGFAPEVRASLSALTAKVQDSTEELNGQEIGNALSGEE